MHAIRLRAMRLRAWWGNFRAVRLFPTPLQREFNRGDPHGIVRREAHRIIEEMKRDGSWE